MSAAAPSLAIVPVGDPRCTSMRMNDAEISVTPINPVYRLKGRVVSGFQRGSKLLGYPTANLDPRAFVEELRGVPRGVYVGWVRINDGPVYKTMLSLGVNPSFNTKEDTVEAYIFHNFAEDFYGEEMTLIICGFIRPSENYKSLDNLIAAIDRDVRVGSVALDKSPLVEFKYDAFFTSRLTVAKI